MEKVFVADVCDTLFYSNTTFDFISFVLKKERDGRRLLAFKLLIRKHSPFFLFFALLFKITRKDIIRTFTIKLLKNMSKDKLYHYGKLFYDEYLQNKKIEESFAIIGGARDEGAKIYLISSSIDPVISAIAERLEVNYLSSILRYEEGLAKGTLQFDMTGRKSDAFKKLTFQHEKHLTVMTDNFTDKSLLTLADRKIVVSHSSKAESFWKEVNPEFINLWR